MFHDYAHLVSAVVTVPTPPPPPSLLRTVHQQQHSTQNHRSSSSSTVVVVVNPDLPLGDINILVVTDVHSWCGGQKKLYGDTAANEGDILSFVQHMKQYITNNNNMAEQRRDIWFVMNGDFIDGTGLSMNHNVNALLPILERMQYDAINVGNHELYFNHFIQQITSPGSFIEWYGNKYITSNVRYNNTNSQQQLSSSSSSSSENEPSSPIGSNYYILKGQYYNVLTFGFLYNMQNYASSVMVIEVETIIQESWFIDIVKNVEDYDAILVLAHMHVRDPLCQIILDAIRTITGGEVVVPVQFITGHTHVRDYDILDPLSTSFEAGHFLDTLGFVSFPTKQTASNYHTTQQVANESTINGTTTGEHSSITELFKYKYIDTDINVLASTLGLKVEVFPTNDGMEQSQFIERIREELGLNEVIGCIDDTYYRNRSLDASDSLWGYFRDYVVPSRFTGNEVLLLGNGEWRYDIFQGIVSIDDVFGMSTYNNTFWAFQSVPADVIRILNRTMNELPQSRIIPTPLPNYIISPAKSSFYSSDGNFTLVVDSFSVATIEDTLRGIIIPEYDTVMPEREELSLELTTTSIWLDYFQQNSHKCQNSKHTTSTKHPRTKPSASHNGGSEFNDEVSSSDTVRMFFITISVVTMVVLSSIIVHQRGKIFQYIREQKDRATMEAIREYEERDVVYIDDDISEGEFT